MQPSRTTRNVSSSGFSWNQRQVGLRRYSHHTGPLGRDVPENRGADQDVGVDDQPQMSRGFRGAGPARRTRRRLRSARRVHPPASPRTCSASTRVWSRMRHLTASSMNFDRSPFYIPRAARTPLGPIKHFSGILSAYPTTVPTGSAIDRWSDRGAHAVSMAAFGEDVEIGGRAARDPALVQADVVQGGPNGSSCETTMNRGGASAATGSYRSGRRRRSACDEVRGRSRPTSERATPTVRPAPAEKPMTPSRWWDRRRIP